MRIQLVPDTGRHEFLDLPWGTPLEDWDPALLTTVDRGISRHVVRFVERGGALYALKEINDRLAHKEYRLLRSLRREGLPAVEGVGVVSDRPALDAILITRHLDYSLPYRLMLARRPVAEVRDRLPSSLAELLVRLHLTGFFWGDCSLSNTLFARDAGALAAYVVDVETAEQHDQLTDGQRAYDLDIAEENLVGEFYDLRAELEDEELGDPEEMASIVRSEYERLWEDLTAEEEFDVDEPTRLVARLERLNERGFDVEEVELETTPTGYKLRLKPQVVEPGHHRRRLQRLTGLDAQENQARRLLEDLRAYRESLEAAGHKPVSEAAVAGRWLTDVFEPAVASVPTELRGKRAAAELYHELLDHRWQLSEVEGRDVPLEEAIASYLGTVLTELPDERTAIVRPSGTS
ncbi:MAG: DUF4032 domain-containing protein [Actinomycetota bacterium]|nr:DUF4032 domain-containing protein [Actinomycetota bacterium]